MITGGWILLRRVRCARDGPPNSHCCGQLCQLLQQAGVSTRVMIILSPYWKQNNRWLITRNDLKLINRRGKLRSRETPPQGGFVFLLYCLYHSFTIIYSRWVIWDSNSPNPFGKNWCSFPRSHEGSRGRQGALGGSNTQLHPFCDHGQTK